VRPIRILDIRDTHEIGGPGKTILETFRTIDRAHFDMHLAVFAGAASIGETPFVMAAKAAGMPVHLIRGSRPYDPRLVWRLCHLVKELGIDVVHAHEASSDAIGYLASRLGRTRLITTLHGWIGNSPKQRLMIALDRRVVRYFDRVIAVSAQIRDEACAAGVPPERVRLLHNAIVVERYRRTGESGFLAKLLGRAPSSPVIASVGRLSAEKGHADLLEALAIVSAKGCRMSAVLVGDGPERPRLEQQIRELGLEGWVHMPGYLAHPERILEESDLAVLPSHTEGLPNAALEALIMGVPVLATRVGGTPEVVQDGETGRLVEPHSPPALAAALLEFAAEPARWKQMAARGRETVESRFNFTTRTRMQEDIYRELMARPAR
jgi:glycosyltransferase involved in cell wall biosynthesis